MQNEFGQPVGEPVPAWAARPLPGPVTLTGDSVIVTELREDVLPELYAALCSPSDDERWTYIPTGPFRSLAAFSDDLRRGRANGLHTYAIVDASTLTVLGMASLMRVDPAHGCVEVGYIMYSPPLARSRAATEAQILLARYVFDDLGYRRYEWKCDALNEPSRRAALRLGFREEGTFRQAMVYKGRNRDTAWFAMTDADWPRVRAAYDDWLAATPLTGDQTVSLSSLMAQAR